MFIEMRHDLIISPLSLFSLLSRACEFNGVEFADSVFEFNRPGIGHVFLYLAIEGPLLMLLTIVIEVCHTDSTQLQGI